MQITKNKAQMKIGYAAARLMQIGGLGVGLYGAAKTVLATAQQTSGIFQPLQDYLSSFAAYQNDVYPYVALMIAGGASLLVGDVVAHRQRVRPLKTKAVNVPTV